MWPGCGRLRQAAAGCGGLLRAAVGCGRLKGASACQNRTLIRKPSTKFACYTWEGTSYFRPLPFQAARSLCVRVGGEYAHRHSGGCDRRAAGPRRRRIPRGAAASEPAAACCRPPAELAEARCSLSCSHERLRCQPDTNGPVERRASSSSVPRPRASWVCGTIGLELPRLVQLLWRIELHELLRSYGCVAHGSAASSTQP